MNYENMNSKWEEIFFQEALELEEKMNLLTADELNKSRIRLLLENNILTWQKYQVWFTEQLQCTSLSSNLTQAQLLNLRKQSAQTLEAYQQYDFWSEDLVPLQTWDGHLIVAGLEFNENLLLIPNLIFVLAEPFVLSFISDNLEENDNAHDFLNLEVASEKPSGPVPSPEPSSDAVWDYLTERHEEYSFEAKKLFSGYVVLKIVDFKTQVFKMDSDLGHYLKQTDVFTYDLSLDNAFRRV